MSPSLAILLKFLNGKLNTNMEPDTINLIKTNKYSFPGQYENENIALVVRRHKIILLTYGFYIILMSAIPPIFYFSIMPNALSGFLYEPYDKIFILLSIIFYGFVWIAAFTVWLDYYLDIWIVTDQRILDVEQVGLFSRVVSEVDLEKIQDVTSEVHGMPATIFGFGDIHIQTAAEKTRFVMKSVPHPVTARREIIKLYRKAKEKEKHVFVDVDKIEKGNE